MKWEYKKTGCLDETAMNELGGLGWELVAVIGRGYTGIMIFKRQIKED